MPHYKFGDFKKACAGGTGNVFVTKTALEGAKNHFNIPTISYLLEFIINDGLEALSFINTTPLRTNKNSSNPILVDAYDFRSACKLGYIAFMHNNTTRKWTIKSFKLSENRNPAMSLALREAGLIKTEENQ